jgi:uncharacterized SAM-binding protein YcdF (DUF218 family)
MKKVLLVLLLLVVAVGLALALLAYDVHAFETDAADIDADAAIVLGASIEGDQPSPVLRERINHAIELLKSGKVRWIIFTGACPEGCQHAEATVARQYALACGVPADKVLIETKSHTTYQNLYFAREVARENGLAAFAVVSDPYHLRRAMRMAEELGMDARPSGTPTSKLNNADFLLRETLRNARFLIYHTEASEMAVGAH